MTQCGWIRLFNTVDIGTKITNSWKLFCYGINREHYENFICIRELLERLAMYCFSNTFTTDTRTPVKNTTYLDDIDNESTVSTCRRLNYSISSPRNSEISTIPEIAVVTVTTTPIGHTASKEVEEAGGRYNRAVRGY